MLMLYNLITVTIVLIWFKSNILLDRIWWNQTKESFYSIYSSIIYCCCCAVKGGTFTTTILREDVCKLVIRQRFSSRMTHRFRKADTHTHTYTCSLSHCILSRSHQLKADGDRQAFHSSFSQPLYDGCKRSGHRGFNTQAPSPMSPALPGLFCEPVIGIELSLVVGAKEDYARRLGVRRRLVADQAVDLWESPMAFLLG